MASPWSHDDNDDSSLQNLSVTSPDALRPFSRSPHPYHRTSISRTAGASTGIDNPSAATSAVAAQTDRLHPTPPPAWSKTPSDSGTEADDESTGILKGLPAPPSRSRKGLSRSEDSTDPWVPALLPWPALARSRARELSRGAFGGDGTTTTIGSVTSGTDRLSQEKRVEVLRRLLEVVLLVSVGVVVVRPADVREIAWVWKKELIAHSLLVTGLYVAYPFCVSTRWPRARLFKLPAFTIPMSFDPAPLLYPIAIPVFVALSLTQRRPTLVLPNIVLGLSSLPTPVIPLQGWIHGYSVMHWMVTLIPILVAEYLSWGSAEPKPLSLYGIDSEALTLVFPLQQALIPILDFLLATSLLPAELQLLASALINLLLFASSPQAKILKAMLWLGGLCIFVLCRHVLRWEVALARIPSWRFRRFPTSSQSRRTFVNDIDHTICEKLSRIGEVDLAASDSDVEEDPPPLISSRRTVQESQDLNPPGELASAVDKAPTGENVALPRRNTISTLEEVVQSAQVRTTPKGRRKRLMAPELASLLSMTVPQAQVRKWLYALYAYIAVLAIALGPVRKYVGDQALDGQEPFGWALGYLFGNLPMFRFWVVMMNLERWIRLPVRLDDDPSCMLGSIEHLRQDTFGEANTRLLISAYCFTVLLTGMAVVLKLSSIAQVDTRRKVFHGMMVLMFLPTIFVDPAFSALALGTVLSIFLLLDLFRASQLPPISRPLTYFLTPYVDGRDHRGPVIVSHIFLLIGCSIPLWLSLADIPRNITDEGPWSGWNVLSRETSMVSGVICVGMGDAAASLIGRRFGRLKWFWGGGKSLEGSVAFALAVFAGLILARGWLVIGRWPVIGENPSDPLAHGDMVAWGWLMVRAMLAAGGTSATEAILTGCNDNVAVPVVLWLLVKGMGV